ncbi:phage holin family protein [Romboutsia ilealis]|uniref:Phage holin family protein n=1 Tax=Romboutsia faecis TaxID=2764597 RepID=A0ABR7JNS9_9FIRM|nr:phage holin family protein [Romboutsia faecis]MBC5996580.1 phage holin family protein [Romboutsia faecis]MRN24105.1 phage holin family protein [Romboutsia ilealis]
MKRFSLFIVINAISLFIVSNIMDSMYIGSLKALLILTLIFGLLNTFVKPIIQFFSLPITFLSLGLFSLVINGIVLKLAFSIVSDVHLYGLFNAIIASILLSIANTIFYNIFDE